MPVLSILVPLTDLRTCGWEALASAVAQERAAGDVEVVAVLGRPDPAAPPAPDGLLDAPQVVVVRTDADAADPDDEIRFYTEGVARATGALVFFAEGHTILFPHAARTIVDWFAAHPGADAAWAPRINRQTTPLGELVGLNNARADVIARAGGRGMFSLGANSIVRRARFEALGGLDPALGRVAEVDFEVRLRRAGIALPEIPEPLCTHDNDMPFAQFAVLAEEYARARRRYFERCREVPVGMTLEPLTGLRRVLTRKPLAFVSRRVLRGVGRAFLAQGVRVVRASPDRAYRHYLRALAAFDLAGAC